MNDIQLFLAHAIRLEEEAARRYEELAAEMRTFGNADVEEFFRRMGRFSRQHLADATARGGFRQLPVLGPEEYQWPDGTSPEAAAWAGVDAFVGVPQALDMALDAERRGLAFYAVIAATSANPEVKAMAAEFAEEESGHVSELQTWIARLTTGA